MVRKIKRSIHDAPQLGRAHGLLQEKSAGKADFPSCNLIECYGHGHHTHAANLDEEQNNRLTKETPSRCSIHGNEAGDTGGGCSRKERSQKGRSPWAWAGKGEHQEQRPQQDDTGKAQQHRMGGRQAKGQFHVYSTSYLSAALGSGVALIYLTILPQGLGNQGQK